MSVEPRWLHVLDLLNAQAHWCHVEDAKRTARVVCRMMGRDPDEVVDSNEVWDFDDEDEAVKG